MLNIYNTQEIMEANHHCQNGYLTIIPLDRHYYTNNHYYYGKKNTKVSRVFTIHIRWVKYNLGGYKKIINAHTGGIRAQQSKGSSGLHACLHTSSQYIFKCNFN